MPFRDTTDPSEILAVHAALVPGGAAGRVLLFGGDEHHGGFSEPRSGSGWKKTRLYDVASGELVAGPIPSPGSDVFCAGHAFLADGRLLIGGGTSEFPVGDDPHAHGLSFGGHRLCWAYNPTENEWVEMGSLLPEPGKETGGGRWYPTLLTLGTGQVIAFFGHPRLDDTRHRNTIAEKYSEVSNTWSGLPQLADPTLWPFGEESDEIEPPPPEEGPRVRHLMFPRVFQLPNARLFFASGMPVTTDLTYQSTFYDPSTGDYVGTPFTEAPGHGNGWDFPAVLLPLLPSALDEEDRPYRPRVLFVGNVRPVRVDLGAATPAWQQTVDRTGSVREQRRRHGMAVLLPTGQVCAINGVHIVSGDVFEENEDGEEVRTAHLPETPTLRAEIYEPGIDWTTGTYTAAETWTTDEDDAQHARNYHSTALLLPDGSIWIGGGNTNAYNGDPDDTIEFDDGTEKKRGIKVIEIYDPPYPAGDRPTLAGAPAVINYGQRFEASSPQAASIQRAALIRFGSATHGHNYDQRYVGLNFERDGNDLFFTAPPNGNVAPPGFYMLWIIDDEGRPCELASIVRLAPVHCDLILDRSTFGVHEVEALLSEAVPAIVPNAVYAVFDGFRPTELGDPPTPPTATPRFADDNSVVPTAQMRLRHRETLLEDESASEDVVQRVTFVYDVEFANGTIFETFTEQRNVRVELTTGPHRCVGTLVLLTQPNPYMVDISATEDNPHWLSIDLRVFQIAENDSFQVAGAERVTHGSGAAAPSAFLSDLLDKLDDNPGAFDSRISTDQATSKLELSRTVSGRRIYNYAIAQVRYRALATDAVNVQMFFRMFTTAATDLRYNTNVAYARTGDWPDSVPLLGKISGELVSVPFLAAPRVDTTAGGVSMTTQTDPLNRRTIDFGGAAEVTEYFGAWLDFNQTTPRFPILPGDSDGPFTGMTPLTTPRSIQELIRGQHQCLVAELRYQPGTDDPIPNYAAPAQSDRLAQRNLAIVKSDNPGAPGSRTVAHTFELSPSPIEPIGYPVGVPLGRTRLSTEHTLTRLKQPSKPDELLIRWGNFPRGSEVEVTFGDLDVDAILELAATRQGPPILRKIDHATLGITVGEATWIPVPGPLQHNIPALLSVQLPNSVKAGDLYTASVAQVSGPLRTVLGTWQLSTPVSKAANLRASEVRTLSVLKHIASTIPPTNRWHPIFGKYVENVAGRVEAFGTDPDDVYANPDGTGVVWVSDEDDERPDRGRKDRPDRRDRVTGRVKELVYDACGCFEGFLLETCDGKRVKFRSSDRGIERVVRAACVDGLLLTVHGSEHSIRRLVISCC